VPRALQDGDPRIARIAAVGPRTQAEREDRASGVGNELLVNAAVAQAPGRRPLHHAVKTVLCIRPASLEQVPEPAQQGRWAGVPCQRILPEALMLAMVSGHHGPRTENAAYRRPLSSLSRDWSGLRRLAGMVVELPFA
jgi:hypothetical protein